LHETVCGYAGQVRGGVLMGIGFSLFLIAAGAVLAFAVNAQVSGLELQTIGLILMVIGGLGLVLTLLFWSDFSPYRRRDRAVDGDVVYEERREVLR
jgi:hypothetical protein